MPEISPNPPSILQVSAPRPPANPVVVILLSVVLTLVAVDLYQRHEAKPGPAPAPAPAPAVDSHFVGIARQVEPTIAPAYGQAWLAFSQALDAGQSFSAAMKTLEDKWNAGRQSVAGPLLAEMAKIVPNGTADAAVTPSQRAAASAAARGIAQGLNKGQPFHIFPLHFEATPPVEAGPVVADSGPSFGPRAELVSRTLNPPEAAPPPARETTSVDRATPPTPPRRPAWHWRYFLSDPRIEAFGYIADDGVFYFAETRWRSS